MLISETTEMKWNAKNKKRYVELGYEYTKMGDTFTISTQDMSKRCQNLIDVKCDYCGVTYKTKWAVYWKGRLSGLQKDCCSNPNCTGKKASEVMELKHGVKYSAYMPSAIAKRKATCVERYGTENPFASTIIKDKICVTNMAKYGVPYTQQNKMVRAKTAQTCKQRYGVDNYVELFRGRFIGENSPVWKGGAEYSRAERATHDYVSWRKSVFAKDQYTCQKCGAKNGMGEKIVLHAHHILNWADNIECRYDTQNGITLCDKCHIVFHQQFGKHNNSYEQILRFLTDEKVC